MPGNVWWDWRDEPFTHRQASGKVVPDCGGKRSATPLSQVIESC